MASVFLKRWKPGVEPKLYARLKAENGVWTMRPVPPHASGKPRSKKEAITWAHARQEEISRGALRIMGDRAAELAPGEKTFAQVLDKWLQLKSAGQRSHDDNVSRSKRLRDEFGHLPISKVRRLQIDEFTDKLRTEPALDNAGKPRKGADGKPRRLAPNSVNRYLALLRQVLRQAAKWEMIDAAPIVELLKVTETKRDILTLQEASDFLTWTRVHQPVDFPLYLVALHAGLRQGELFSLRWEDVDLDLGQITVCRSNDGPTKSGKVRYVPIGSDVLARLREWKVKCQPSDEGLCFPREDGTRRPREKPPVGFEAALRGAGIKRKVVFHCLRHTVATNVANGAGADPRAAQQMLGHSSYATTANYVHDVPEAVRRQAERIQIPIGDAWGEVVAMPVGSGQ